MRRIFSLVMLILILAGCDSYLEERLEFLELPFEYEGKFNGYEFNLGWDLAWGVPDNGDDGGIYFAQNSRYMFYWRDDGQHLINWLNDPQLRRVASVVSPGMFYTMEDTGSDEVLLHTTDFSSWAVTPWGGLTDTGFTGGSRRSLGSGASLYVAGVDPEPVIEVYATDIGGISYTGPTSVLNSGGFVTLANVMAQGFPEADGTWGTPTVKFHAFAPASLASYEGEHKFIISRTDGLTGDQKTVLVSINQSTYSFSTRQIGADSDFYFVSRDRFVGMDGDELKIFTAAGDQLASHILKGMRLLGYRSSTDRELVFLYSSDEDDGERVWGIYSLPASFIEEAE